MIPCSARLAVVTMKVRTVSWFAINRILEFVAAGVNPVFHGYSYSFPGAVHCTLGQPVW
jgi:hypothetical protein